MPSQLWTYFWPNPPGIVCLGDTIHFCDFNHIGLIYYNSFSAPPEHISCLAHVSYILLLTAYL